MGTRLELTVVAVVRLAKVCIVRYIELYAGLQHVLFVFNCYDNPMFLCYIVTVQIVLYTKHEGPGISWTLSPNCASHKEIVFNVEAKRSYLEECALAEGESYELSCDSFAGNGWSGSFLVIENKAYCENFREGSKETATIKIEVNYTVQKLKQSTCKRIKLTLEY